EDLLHDRVERARHVYGAERNRAHDGGCDRTVVPEADLPVRVLPAGDHRVDGGSPRLLAAGQTVHPRGRVRAALLLRLRLGGCRGAPGPLADLEGAAANPAV